MTSRRRPPRHMRGRGVSYHMGRGSLLLPSSSLCWPRTKRVVDRAQICCCLPPDLKLRWVPDSRIPQWIAKQQLARQGTKCFWREPVGQQKSAQRHRGTNVPQNRVPAGTEDDRLSHSEVRTGTISYWEFTLEPWSFQQRICPGGSDE
jgi:hypothetical protein